MKDKHRLILKGSAKEVCEELRRMSGKEEEKEPVVYAEMLIAESIFDKLIEDYKYPEVTLFQAHILTSDNYEKYVTKRLKDLEEENKEDK